MRRWAACADAFYKLGLVWASELRAASGTAFRPHLSKSHSGLHHSLTRLGPPRLLSFCFPKSTMLQHHEIESLEDLSSSKR